ncbi:MAG: ABC transporter permease [Candidatus Competibacterales bacterium]
MATVSPSSESAQDGPSRAATSLPRWLLLRRSLGHLGLLLGGITLLFIIVIALAAPWLTEHSPYAQDLSSRLIPPFWSERGSPEHWLGTDFLGRDYFARLVHGAQISLLIGTVSALIAGVIGTGLGVAAGYFGGRIDAVVTFLITVRLSLPVVLVALAVVALIGSSLTVVIAVLGLLLWDRFAVVMRATTLELREADYVNAARALGLSPGGILLREVLPNALNPLIVVTTLEIAHAILLEAALSFLGLGVQPPLPSWGLMVAEGRDMMLFEPWLIVIPGIALFFLILSVNLVGDGVRDVTAPENRV